MNRPDLVSREVALQRLVTAYILAGLLCLLLPGTFLGVWNLLSISATHTAASLSPAWLQAHGHAQIFGWLGTFILGIGFYSLSKMGNLPPFAVSRGWTCFAIWTAGVWLRWTVNVTAWHWRILLPGSAALELAAFLIFFRTVSSHRPEQPAGAPRVKQPWMLVVVGSTIGFLATLAANLGVTAYVALRGDGPAIPSPLDQHLLILPTWGFLVPVVWGFNARWLPVFLGLDAPHARRLYAALLTAWLAVAAMLSGFATLSTALLPVAALLAISALHVFSRSMQPAKITGVHPSFPVFVRGAYVWLLVAAGLSLAAALADRENGIWGASRHALTVGFLSTMVFAIGQRILPAFCGARVLFSKNLMLASLALLNLGCALRVASEIPAYEGYLRQAWSVLPVSAVIELAAVALFAANLSLTLLRPPAHLLHAAAIPERQAS
ncbi:MAG TPA: NnrS family protein [Bryobacteraceae bacterium]|nr:NnrS family protein [Bryobacteraceae bacterium]